MTVILAAHAQWDKNTHYAIEDGSLVLYTETIHTMLLVSSLKYTHVLKSSVP